MRRAAGAVARFFGGGVACVHPIGAFVALGWLCELMRRATHARWRSLGGVGELAAPPAVGVVRSLLRFARGGLQASVNYWVVTLPGAGLWYFAWYAGWNNSFNKGYEHAFVAPGLGLLGMALFAAAMFHVPLAQARQAATGDWRAFYGFKTVWALVGEKWLSSLFLAAAYAAAALPVLLLRALPNFLPMMDSELERVDAARARAFMDGYNLLAALLVFALLVALRLAAARIYASGLAALARGGVACELHPEERAALAAYRLEASTAPSRGRFVAWARWAATGTGRLVSAAGVTICWLAFGFTVFLAQFLNYQAGRAWLNQPLVQLPWAGVAVDSKAGKPVLGAHD